MILTRVPTNAASYCTRKVYVSRVRIVHPVHRDETRFPDIPVALGVQSHRRLTLSLVI